MLKQKEAEKAALIAEKKVQEEKNSKLKELASVRVILEEKKVFLSQFQTQWTENTKNRQEFYTEASKILGDLSAQLGTEQSLEKTENNYKNITNLWLTLSKRVYQFYGRQDILFKIPELPPSPKIILESLKDDPQTLEYLGSYDEALKTRESLSQSIQTRLDEENQQNFRLLLTAGQLRAQYISLLRRHRKTKALSFNQDYFNDIYNEIRIIPYRWIATFYSRILDVRQQLNIGFQGYLSLSKDVFLIGIIIAIVFLFFFSLKNLIRSLTHLKDKLLHAQTQTNLSRALAIWIPRLNPYIPWIISLIALEFMYDLLSITLFAEFSLFLPYLEYYIIYRVFRELITSSLISFSFRAKINFSESLRKKIQSTAKTIGLFLFLISIILHTVSSIARKGLLYYHTLQFSWFFGFFMLAIMLHNWKKEIVKEIRSLFPQKSKLLNNLNEKWWGVLFQLFSILLLAFIYLLEFIKKIISDFELTKRISAKLFKRQVEKGTKKESYNTKYQVPEDYLKWFSYEVPQDSELLIEPHSDLFTSIIKMIDDWKNDSEEEHSLAIYGDKGSGKSCLLKIIRNKIKNLNIIQSSIPPKLTTVEAVLEYVANLLGTKYDGSEDWLNKIDENLDQTIILLDECQNLFLSKVDGFEGFKAFIDLINLKTKNVFWCMSFNRQSWNYLFDVFGRHEFYRSAFKIDSWDDEDIQKLVETRHKKSGFVVSYDEIISAAASSQNWESSYVHIERQFFRLLWEQANGNPRAAIHLWLSSLTPVSNQKLKVGLPREDNDYRLSSLLDNLHFVYAQLVRHENLTTEEAVETTNLSKGIVSHALKIGLERGFLERNSLGRYRITPSSQDHVLKYLTAKNFIYGK